MMGAMMPIAKLPRLTQAQAPLTHDIEVLDEFGQRRRMSIPAERPLTVFVDKRELVTLMTLGLAPELLVLGYLRNQRLVASVDEIESITVDWEVGAAAVRTRSGIDAIEEKTAHRVVTTGCGQGTVFGSLMADVESVDLPGATEARLRQSTLYAMLDQMRRQDSVYKKAGSVHGCALFRGGEMQVHFEDVGRHNAIDTIAGWMWMNGVVGGDKSFYTTGRLTSEMVMKAAQMGVPIVVSRNGITQMGHALAMQLGLTLIGRAKHRHFICYSGLARFDSEPEPARVLAEIPA
ncbi:FdhD protein [Roseateles toxinivorans]|uniref:Sulfur carrier protein FdhD n=2 Tax=Roseateles toxinivorans TaxID=270368 RepID=A0A4R6QPW0_9BURK|nr:FdhD protein [Roseateles toxinivorans]